MDDDPVYTAILHYIASQPEPILRVLLTIHRLVLTRGAEGAAAFVEETMPEPAKTIAAGFIRNFYA